MTQILCTPTPFTPEPMPRAVVTALQAITDRYPEIDYPMFRLDGDYIAYEGHDDGRLSLVDVPGDGLYARFDRCRRSRVTGAEPQTVTWVPVSEWPVTRCDVIGIARTMWRLTAEDAM